MKNIPISCKKSARNNQQRTLSTVGPFFAIACVSDNCQARSPFYRSACHDGV